MRKDQLLQYRSLVKEIKELNKRIEKLREKSKTVVSDKVKGSNIEYPYQELDIRIYGVSNEKEHLEKLEQILNRRLGSCNRLRIQIEDYISGIKDSRIRLIFEKRYLQGWSWQKISIFLGSNDESYARKIHDRYLNK